MECAAKGRVSACLRGPPSRHCGLCGAVAYCSKAHQMLHWNDHKEECGRLAQQMRQANVLSDFPFTFSEAYPHLVIASNAGVAAYLSWLPTIELLKEMGIPAIFSDFYEEAAHLAASCVGSVTRKDLRLPVQLNPFRQRPMVVENSALYLPCFLNCFLFGM